jgi:myo-inositol 2-dehydrogenase/D-chiro-inositol 1-dehydrogenase
MNEPMSSLREPSRRAFLAASAIALPLASSAHAAGSDRIRLGLIGCGPRGCAAALEAMEADRGVKLVAMGDLLMDRVREKRDQMRAKRPEQASVTLDQCFSGFDAYKHVIEASDVVIIANAAKFHPLHMMAAIQAGKHVFVEKPHAVDPAGVKVVQAVCNLAHQKGLCVVSGLHSRYDENMQDLVRRVHEGAIGRIVTIEENYLREPYNIYARQPGLTEVEWQASTPMHFHWLGGDDVVQSLVHNLDRASWVLNGAVPLKCHGVGGRSTLRGEQYGNVFDHHAIVYEFPESVRVRAFCRTVPDCYDEYSSLIYGTKGDCDIMDLRITGQNAWKRTGDPARAHYAEQVQLFKALRAGKLINNGDYMARSTLIAIMGQIACYSGKEITWEQISNSDFCFLPRPEDVRADMDAPVKPDAEGIYPPAFVPGVSKLL